MQIASEIESNLNNLRYYTSKITELAKTQFKFDYERGQQLGINAGPGSIRYDSLGAMIQSCSLIDTYCDNIKANLETAVKQDKLLYIEEEPDE